MLTQAETDPNTIPTPEGADPELFARIYEAMPTIIGQSNRIMLGNTALARFLPPRVEGPDELALIVKERFCLYTSDAATRIAQQEGLPASREQLRVSGGYHFVTYFGDPKTPPSENDIILCRTWRQFDEERFDNPEHPNGREPFLGTRRQLAELLPGLGSTFTPSGVERRSNIHRPNPQKPPEHNREHQWLHTTPEDLATYNFPIAGEVAPDDTTYHEKYWR